MNKAQNTMTAGAAACDMQKMLDRGVQEVLPSRDFLFSQLAGPKKLKIYAGFDPTGPTLHIGHAIILKKLKQFQYLGHQVVMLIGDFTAMIGDPTDKTATRKVLTEKEIKDNLKLYKKQASTFLRFSGKNPALLEYNSTWLKKMNLKGVLELTTLMTVDQMLKRDMFATRMEQGKPISIHEFMYPLLQGYDSVALGVDVEIGGNDQMFNMMVGRDFSKKLKNREKTCITMKLLSDSDGKKMGKTEGNMVSLSDTHFEMFGKIMSWTDDMMPNGFELCTDMPMTEIDQLKRDLTSGSVNPRDAKVRLACEIVSIYFGQSKADEAMANFNKTFSEGGIPEDVPEVFIPAGTPLGMVLQGEKIVESAAEFKRLVRAGAINTAEGDKVDDFNYILSVPAIFKVGKRRFLSIKII